MKPRGVMSSTRPFLDIVRCVMRCGNGRVLAQSRPGYLRFAGGDVRPGEHRIDSGVRQTYEQTGAVLDGVEHFATVNVPWTHEWAKSDAERLQRFGRYAGAREHILIGWVSRFDGTFGGEARWHGPSTMTLTGAMGHMQTTEHLQSFAFRNLHATQMCALHTLCAIELDHGFHRDDPS